LGELRVGEALPPVARAGAGEPLAVAALLDPAAADRGQPRADVDLRLRVRVGAARVVHVHRRILLRAERRGRVRLRDLAHGNTDAGARALDVYLARAGKGLDRGLVDV